MTISAAGDASALSPELAAAMAVAVHAFIESERATNRKPRAGISAWRMAAFGTSEGGLRFGSRGWRERD